MRKCGVESRCASHFKKSARCTVPTSSAALARCLFRPSRVRNRTEHTFKQDSRGNRARTCRATDATSNCLRSLAGDQITSRLDTQWVTPGRGGECGYQQQQQECLIGGHHDRVSIFNPHAPKSFVETSAQCNSTVGVMSVHQGITVLWEEEFTGLKLLLLRENPASCAASFL